MAANQLRNPSIPMGWPTGPIGTSTSLALSAAATWLAFQVVLDQTKTLSAVRLFQVTKTGTPTTAGCTCDLFSDAAGIPNASTEGPISADAIVASGTWMGWTFAGTSVLTAGTPYWFVFKNGTATPASNFPTYAWIAAASGAVGPFPNAVFNSISISSPFYGWGKVHTVNSGGAWASTPQQPVAGIRLQFTDSTYDGFPLQVSTRAGSAATGDTAFGKAEVGVKFNVPANATFNLRGISFLLNKLSTPGSLRMRLYQGVTLIATTNAIPAASVTTATAGDWYTAYFSSAQQLSSANNPYRVVFGDATSGDTNSTSYRPEVATIDSDSNSLTLKPMNGSLQKTITADNTASPVVFADTNTDMIPFALLLDTSGEFAAASGGGLLKVGGMHGGLSRS